MPKYAYPIDNLVTDEDALKILTDAKPRFGIYIALLWITGARPSEIREVKKKDILINEDLFTIKLVTKKLGKVKRFMNKDRTLEFERGKNAMKNIFIEYISEYVSQMENPETILVPYSLQRLRTLLNAATIKHCGKQLCAYHFRHSVFTWMAKKGITIPELKHMKGAASLNSVSPYINAVPFMIKAENLKRGIKIEDFSTDK
jgi:integrase